jgi:hypothetical protein
MCRLTSCKKPEKYGKYFPTGLVFSLEFGTIFAERERERERERVYLSETELSETEKTEKQSVPVMLWSRDVGILCTVLCFHIHYTMNYAKIIIFETLQLRHSPKDRPKKIRINKKEDDYESYT